MEPRIKPYLLRAIHEWCTDCGWTPYVAVKVDVRTQVPKSFVKDGQIVLDIGYEATANLMIESDAIRFKARFGGVSHDIYLPVDNVIALYAKENGQGMSFDVSDAPPPEGETPSREEGGASPTGSSSGLKRVK
ncbi:MAG: ClpXP protease specificity-enhancing factor [Burkholderiaceae bacterium]|jgi:stringent starvation protein B|nr:ClpXP protease specificity-enhancing factor [Burkholderiaceae bacterium]